MEKYKKEKISVRTIENIGSYYKKWTEIKKNGVGRFLTVVLLEYKKIFEQSS